MIASRASLVFRAEPCVTRWRKLRTNKADGNLALWGEQYRAMLVDYGPSPSSGVHKRSGEFFLCNPCAHWRTSLRRSFLVSFYQFDFNIGSVAT
jgi:hypothetical protein